MQYNVSVDAADSDPNRGRLVINSLASRGSRTAEDGCPTSGVTLPDAGLAGWYGVIHTSASRRAGSSKLPARRHCFHRAGGT